MTKLKYLVIGMLLSGFGSTEVFASILSNFSNKAFSFPHDQHLANEERESLSPILIARETSTTTTTTTIKEKKKTNDGKGNKTKTRTTTTTTTTTTAESDDTGDNSGENTGSQTTGVSREGW